MSNSRIYQVSFIVYGLATIFSIGYYHPDEHFQILEFAGTKLGLVAPGTLPWEYPAEMRPAIQPLMVVLSYKFLDLFHFADVFRVAFMLRAFSALLSFAAIHLFIKTFINEINDKKFQPWFIILSFLLWFNVFNSVRFSSENWSGKLFVIGLCLVMNKEKQSSLSGFLLGGLACGFAFIIRFQSAFLILGLMAWLFFIRKEKISRLSFFSLMIILVFGLGIIIDKWFYGHWVLTSWNYLDQNIFQDKASQFGKDAWWYFFYGGYKFMLPPFSAIYLLVFILFLIHEPKHILTWVSVPFFMIHEIVGHKEMRFLFPLITFVPFFMITMFEKYKEQYPGFRNFIFSKAGRLVLFILIFQNFLALAIMVFTPASWNVLVLRALNQYGDHSKVYYLDQNPYGNSLIIHYYEPPEMRLYKVDSINRISPDSNTLLVLQYPANIPEDHSGKIKFTRLYSTFPQWFSSLHLGNWMSRDDIWSLYKIETRK
jgi:phosphatidylinositol glycan class B